MNASPAYDLHWKCIPMGSIKGYENWYYPYLGRGVYMLVLATTNNKDKPYVGFYVGKSEDIGCRWHYHVRVWFGDPPEDYWIPRDADAFLVDPVVVMNNGALSQRLRDRKEIVGKILPALWFCFAEAQNLRSGHRIENVEYVLQERLKTHAGIQQPGHIGDAGVRYPPNTGLTVLNHFGRSFIDRVLPHRIGFEPDVGIQ